MAQVRITFDRNGITQIHAQGLADRDSGRRVTEDDPVRVASISKLVVALGVMRLVEQQRLDLDADVSQLLGWELRHPRWPEVPITLRLLLSHRAGLTDAAGYWQVPLGGEFRALLRDPAAWDAQHAPGTFWRYANVGFPLVAAAMERATGERFDLLMQRLVLRPLRLEACFNWESCDADAIARAVVLYEGGEAVRDDLSGVRPDCAVVSAEAGPCDLGRWRAGENGALFSPQGGLRITARGLARIGQLLLGEGSLDGEVFLARESVLALATPQWQFSGANGMGYEEDTADGASAGNAFCRYGLGVQTLATPLPSCADDPFADGVPRIGHGGNAYGLRSGLWVDLAGGTGVAWFATGVPVVPGRHSAWTEEEERLARGGEVSARAPQGDRAP